MAKAKVPPKRTVTIFVLVLALFAVGALGWLLYQHRAPRSVPTVSEPREIEAQGSSWPIFLLLWAPWPLLGAWAQHQRGGNWGQGLMVGLLFGPLGLLIANYSGGRRGPGCRGRIDPKATRGRRCPIVLPHQEPLREELELTSGTACRGVGGPTASRWCGGRPGTVASRNRWHVYSCGFVARRSERSDPRRPRASPRHHRQRARAAGDRPARGAGRRG